MIKSSITLLAILLIATEGVAQPEKTMQAKPSIISDVGFYASNYGPFGLDITGMHSGFVAPRGSGKSYLFGSGLWFGAKKRVLDSLNSPVWRPLVFMAYNPNSAESWATPGEGYIAMIPEASPARPDLYRSGDYDRKTGESLLPIVPPMKTPAWPLWSQSWRTVRSLDAGIFEPFDSLRKPGYDRMYDAPAFVPGVDEQFVARFHDAELSSYETNEFTGKEGYPIGLQVQQNIYAWKIGKYRHSVVIQYDIINMSTDTLRDCIAAQASDPDIGSPGNDRIQYYAGRPELRVGYAWTDPDSTGEYDTLAMMLLEAPVTNTYGFIDNSRRLDFRLQGTVGAFPHWTMQEDPHTSAERYAFMARESFASDQEAYDQRALMASRSFSMRPGDTAHFAVAYAVIDDSFYRAWRGDDTEMVSAQANNARLETWAISLTNDYYSGEFISLASGVAKDDRAERPAVSVLPNPTGGPAQVRYAVASRSDVRLRVVNGLGEVMIDRSLGERERGIHNERIDTGTLPPGAYLVTIQGGGKSTTIRMNVMR